MKNWDERKTILSLEHGKNKVSVEMSWDAGADEIINALVTCMTGCSFLPETIVECMKEYLEEYSEEDCEN